MEKEVKNRNVVCIQGEKSLVKKLGGNGLGRVTVKAINLGVLIETGM